jgi:hypothetical protein
VAYRINARQVAAVSRLDAANRVKHLVSRVADFESLWSLRGPDGWALSQVPGGAEAVPIWPHPEYAKVCATGQWLGCEPEKIQLNDFLAAWVPGMMKDGRVVAVFPTPNSNAAVLAPSEVEVLLRKELERIE